MAHEPPPEGRKQHPLERRPVAPPPTPPGPEQPRQRVPLRLPTSPVVVTYALVVLNVLVFVARALSPVADEQVFEFGANIPRLVLQGGEYYRLLTAMFLHASVYGAGDRLVLENAMHILLNMYILLAVGPQMERVFGPVRFAIVYLLGGLMGSALSAVLGHLDIASVGASGAVFAVLAAEFIFLYRHRALFGPSAQARMRSLIIWGAINFAFGALTSVAGTRVRIDNWGHLGGLVGGLLLAWFLSPIYLPRRDPADPHTLTVEDSNPLAGRYWVLFLYTVILVAVLVVGTMRARL